MQPSFFAICHSTPCTAKDGQGQTCTGVPILKAYGNVRVFNFKFFILYEFIIFQSKVKGGHWHFFFMQQMERLLP